MSGITTDVCITPRVIAAGVFGSTFRLTLALLPTAPDAARKDAPRFDVSSWPQVVDGAGPIGLFVSPVAAAGDARPAPVYAGAGKAIGVRRRSLLDAKDSEAALRLWRVIVTGQTTPDAQRPEFLHLCDALARSQRAPKGGGTASRVDGAAAGAPAVLPTGRADAALAYTMERAERILAALRNDATASPVARPGATDEQGPPPWTEEYWTPDVTGAVAKRIELAHRKALEARSDEVRAELQPDVERATAQIAARGGYLGEGSLRGAIALLTGSAAGRCSRNPSEASAASSDAATQHVRALHEASTLPDDPSASPSPSLGALDGVDVAERRLFALQAHPTLGRLFGLVVDVEGDLADLDASLAAAFAGGFADLAFGPEAGAPPGSRSWPAASAWGGAGRRSGRWRRPPARRGASPPGSGPARARRWSSPSPARPATRSWPVAPSTRWMACSTSAWPSSSRTGPWRRPVRTGSRRGHTVAGRAPTAGSTSSRSTRCSAPRGTCVASAMPRKVPTLPPAPARRSPGPRACRLRGPCSPAPGWRSSTAGASSGSRPRSPAARSADRAATRPWCSTPRT